MAGWQGRGTVFWLMDGVFLAFSSRFQIVWLALARNLPRWRWLFQWEVGWTNSGGSFQWSLQVYLLHSSVVTSSKYFYFSFNPFEAHATPQSHSTRRGWFVWEKRRYNMTTLKKNKDFFYILKRDDPRDLLEKILNYHGHARTHTRTHTHRGTHALIPEQDKKKKNEHVMGGSHPFLCCLWWYFLFLISRFDDYQLCLTFIEIYTLFFTYI